MFNRRSKMQNPVPKSNLWHTPETLEELYAMVDQYTGQEAALAAHIMMLTLNTCNRLVEKAKEAAKGE
jgi:hypothetical protein